MPDDRHNPAGKQVGITCRVERFGRAPRLRCGRFVRKAPPPSKCWRNHAGALRYFVRHDNPSLQ